VELLGVRGVAEVLPAADLLAPLNDTERKLLALADAIPEEKYAFRPQPGVRSVGEVFSHIANGNQLMLEMATGRLTGAAVEKQIAANETLEKTPATKASLRARLVATFMLVRKELEAARNGTLAREIAFFGTPSTERGALTFLSTHAAEHLGQLITYARLAGVSPPWANTP
jgi:uncharacterized damage-inducible protein DinB